MNRCRFHLDRVGAGFVAQFFLFGGGGGDAVGAEKLCRLRAGGKQFLSEGRALRVLNFYPDGGSYNSPLRSAISKTTSPSFKSGFNPPAKPQVKTSSGELVSAKNSRMDFSAFWRPMPVRRIEMPELPAAIFRNGAASSFKAKQTRTGGWRLASGVWRLHYLIPASLSFQIR